MLNKLKKTFYADDFSYFIRYFGVFTLIFSAMTLIIIQVMRSSLYTTVDDNLKSLSQNPAWVANLAYRTTGRQYQEPDNKDSENRDSESVQAHDIKIEEPGRVNVSANTSAILLNDDYQNVSAKNSFLNFDAIKFNKRFLNQIKQIQLTNSYGQVESYRAYMFDIDPDDEIENVKYAVVMTSISQLEQTSEKHEKLIAIVMISFWGISWTACRSRSPLLKMPATNCGRL